MLRFFSLLRKKLLEEGHIRKYVWYALVEVFLVVIGILIALQINNWNEDRKQFHAETELLTTMLRDLRGDSTRHGYMSRDARIYEELLQQIYVESRDGAVPSDTLEVQSLRRGRAYSSRSMRNHADNTNFIHNEELRDVVNRYFFSAMIADEATEFFNEYLITDFRPYLTKHRIHNVDAIFDDTNSLSERQYVKYDKLVEQYGSDEFDQHLFSLKLRTQYYQEQLNLSIEQMNIAIDRISTELKLRK